MSFSLRKCKEPLWAGLSPISVVAINFNVKGQNAALGIIGPARTSYPTVIPVLRYFGDLVQQVAGA